ncbi:hypothetical protein FQY83_04775 [Luteimonas marina]|uniref:Entry exclusion lipoprotein TrbK n=1 Tax=Luteimonas marina TaxID=488485 RepID=A0A5C5U8V1_9GAMM|nr:hypothetical protein [Luteimonas marina]TWT22348.1 hypothetical protein FQY83_04775 [Luteimonas marina]
MRMPTAMLLVAALATGCASQDYRDTNAAVDANPACASRPDRPGEPVSAACERKAEATWSSERKSGDRPIDFSRKPKDD